jgi:uncharacterized membrane protein
MNDINWVWIIAIILFAIIVIFVFAVHKSEKEYDDWKKQPESLQWFIKYKDKEEFDLLISLAKKLNFDQYKNTHHQKVLYEFLWEKNTFFISYWTYWTNNQSQSVMEYKGFKKALIGDLHILAHKKD